MFDAYQAFVFEVGQEHYDSLSTHTETLRQPYNVFLATLTYLLEDESFFGAESDARYGVFHDRYSCLPVYHPMRYLDLA